MWRLQGIISCFIVLLMRCSPSPMDLAQQDLLDVGNPIRENSIASTPLPQYISIKRQVLMGDYFGFIDSIANTYFQSNSFPEYVLINANPWIIDSLRSLDYYHQQKKGRFIYDHAQQIILRAGDSLLIPDSVYIKTILNKLKSTRIDVNLPEYKLRIIQEEDTLLTTQVRIGKNDSMYLEFYQRKIDMRTPIGKGEIVATRKEPKFIDLQTGIAYVETKRDDGRRTKMPIMPSLTPTINGKITGTLIHATTNPISLGKASSHGCIGTSEPDIWSIYYYSPVGTQVTFRYDLMVKDNHGNEKKLRDIYHLKKN